VRRGEFDYIPRKPQETVLYQVIAEQLESFAARAVRNRNGRCPVSSNGAERLACSLQFRCCREARPVIEEKLIA
jgi:hypothetical protein